MGYRTTIEWCHHTFNIVWGCAQVSPGCAHCYAKQISKRWGFQLWSPWSEERRSFGDKYWSQPLAWDRAAGRSGERHRVFTSSMGDVFEEHPVVNQERYRLWPLIKATPNLDWMLLTKRPEHIEANLPSDWGNGYPNVWLGTSVENHRFRWRLTELAKIPAVLRFVSVEPLLGPLDLTPWLTCCPNLWGNCEAASKSDESRMGIESVALQDFGGLPQRSLDWVILGGESGRRARSMRPEWAERIVRQCTTFGIPIFVKQLGGHPNRRAGDEAVINNKIWRQVPSG